MHKACNDELLGNKFSLLMTIRCNENNKKKIKLIVLNLFCAIEKIILRK